MLPTAPARGGRAPASRNGASRQSESRAGEERMFEPGATGGDDGRSRSDSCSPQPKPVATAQAPSRHPASRSRPSKAAADTLKTRGNPGAESQPAPEARGHDPDLQRRTPAYFKRPWKEHKGDAVLPGLHRNRHRMQGSYCLIEGGSPRRHRCTGAVHYRRSPAANPAPGTAALSGNAAALRVSPTKASNCAYDVLHVPHQFVSF
jgi:hypothetical protein